MTVYGYRRVSTEEQVRDGLSLEMQSDKISAYCDLHGLGVPEFFSDEGISGSSIAKRPGILALLEAVQSDQGTHVVVYKLDRVCRNVRELLGLVERFEKMGVGFHSVSERVDTKSATGRFFMTIIGAIAEWERGVISERTRDILKRKSDNGEPVGHPPLGWRVEYGPEVNMKGKLVAHWVRDSQGQQTIERILKLHNEGISVRGISRELHVCRDTVQKVIRKGVE